MNTLTVERFWKKVNKTDTCWLWTASKRNKGYGAFVWATETGEIIQGRAHRFSWEICNGPIPDGLCVLHKCDVPACVNPDHLFLGTKKDNNADMARKGRRISGGTKCGKNGKWPRGEAPHGARLNPEIVTQIRNMKGVLSYSQIARNFGVTISSAWKICNGKAWSHVQ